MADDVILLDLNEAERVHARESLDLFMRVHLAQFHHCLPDPSEWDEQGHIRSVGHQLMIAKQLLTGFPENGGHSIMSSEVPEAARQAREMLRDEISWTWSLTEQQKETLQAALELHRAVSVGALEALMEMEIAPRSGYRPTEGEVSMAREALERGGGDLVAWRRLQGEEDKASKDARSTRNILMLLAQSHAKRTGKMTTDSVLELHDDAGGSASFKI